MESRRFLAHLAHFQFRLALTLSQDNVAVVAGSTLRCGLYFYARFSLHLLGALADVFTLRFFNIVLIKVESNWWANAALNRGALNSTMV
jgi:hypothetical protein